MGLIKLIVKPPHHRGARLRRKQHATQRSPSEGFYYYHTGKPAGSSANQSERPRRFSSRHLFFFSRPFDPAARSKMFSYSFSPVLNAWARVASPILLGLTSSLPRVGRTLLLQRGGRRRLVVQEAACGWCPAGAHSLHV
jgi:hypothetical protein